MKWFTPTYYASGISDIDVNNLKAQGIKVIMFDIDNTLVPTSKTPTPLLSTGLKTPRAQACM